MTDIKSYMNDGAKPQAKAVLADLQRNIGNGIGSSWNTEYKQYDANVKVARWENGREQGYVCSLVNSKNIQLNIAWFEHRNSDSIHAIKWEQLTMNAAPTIDNAKFDDIYKDKYDTSHDVPACHYAEMGKWIYEQLKSFWDAGKAEN